MQKSQPIIPILCTVSWLFTLLLKQFKTVLQVYDASLHGAMQPPLLSRRPEGWYIQAREFYGDTSMPAHLFYSIHDSSYQEIPFKERSYESSADTESLSVKWISQTNQFSKEGRETSFRL